MESLNFSGLWDWSKMKMRDCISEMPYEPPQVMRVFIL